MEKTEAPPISKPQTSPPNSPVSLNDGSRTCRPLTQTWSVCSSPSSPVYAIAAPTMRGPASWECKQETLSSSVSAPQINPITSYRAGSSPSSRSRLSSSAQ
ncbi:hypothetical protein N7445_005202 [Penicillium cf. griseofulvum]|nr:hypothetical protein N7445_005202 [Penicillium cf. griseofulvum]